MNSVRGPDFSYYDFIINWKLFDNDFVFIKCSEGTVIDKIFRTQWKEARGRAVRGAYHFFRPFVDPNQAATKFTEYLGGDMGELPPVLDLEVTDNRSDAVPRALDFLGRFRSITGIKPIIYSSLGFLSHNDVKAHNYPELADYKFWMALYPFDRIYPGWTESDREKRLTEVWNGSYLISFPPPPRPFKKVTFWQFTGKGNPSLINGYQSTKDAVDLNFYNGETVADMFREFNITHIPKPQGEEMDKKYFRVKSLTNIRNGPYDSYTDIGDLVVGSTIEAVDETTDNIGRTWYRLSAATNPQGGAILVRVGGVSKQVSEVVAWCFAGNLEEVNPVPDPDPEPPTNKRPFSFKVDGFKEYTGELEEE